MVEHHDSLHLIAGTGSWGLTRQRSVLPPGRIKRVIEEEPVRQNERVKRALSGYAQPTDLQTPTYAGHTPS